MTKAQRWLRINGTTIGGDSEQEITTDLESAATVTVAADETNFEIDLTVTLANAKAIGLVADQDCTVKTNSSSTPDDTITLKADQALVWCENDPADTKFLTEDLTKIYVTTTVETVIKFGHASDVTPA